ncbi:hypothetical protein ACQP1W_21225 [Spirillospora sp. CA-255316]
MNRRDPMVLTSIAALLGVAPPDVADAAEAILAPLSNPRRLREAGVLESDLQMFANRRSSRLLVPLQRERAMTALSAPPAEPGPSTAGGQPEVSAGALAGGVVRRPA